MCLLSVCAALFSVCTDFGSELGARHEVYVSLKCIYCQLLQKTRNAVQTQMADAEKRKAGRGEAQSSKCVPFFLFNFFL